MNFFDEKTLEGYGEENFVLGDIFHWSIDDKGCIEVKENVAQKARAESFFENFDIDKISERIMNE